ncbi:Zinc finger, CCHC-type superfamily [Sesbania bispinosa]|nr:Zinc finger, CCHC-type superfamily [Sesbania bispinosa]
MDDLYEVPIYNLDYDKDMGNDVGSNDSVSGDCTNNDEANDNGNREPSKNGDTHNNDERNEPPMVDVGAHRFVIRKDEIKKDVRGNIVMRQFVCNREGLRNKRHLMRLDRKRDHRAITRTNCEAKLRIRFNRKKKNWRVVSFEESHNHELTPPRFVHLHSAYHKLTDGDKAQVDSLHAHGVRTGHIMGYMLAQKGGYCNVGFARKDVYNYIYINNRVKIKDGDALAALSYLKGRAAHDPTLFAEFRADDKVLTTCLHKIDKETAKIYTLEMFKEVRQEIDKAGALIVIDRAVNRQKLGFTLNSRGIPCSHIFCAMKNEHVDFIPSSLILKRWTKNAKSDLISSYRVDEVHSNVLAAAQISALSAYCNNFVRVAYEKTWCFGEIVDDIFNLQLKYEKKGDPSSTSSSARKIGDPTVVKTKGAPKKRKFSKKRKRHCSNCSGTGHTIRTCPKVGGIDVKADSDNETSPSERSDNNKSNDNDKNEMEFDVSNTQVPVPSQNSSGRNIKKGKEKEKVDPVSTSKVKKVKEIKEKTQVKNRRMKL